MMDWMVEVCTSFKCAHRSYFLAAALFDKYLIKQAAGGRALDNADVHQLGVVAMYLASKYEDLLPLHSKVVSEKIAHKAVTASQILQKEEQILRLFEFEVEFVTHFDFHQTYTDKIERMMKKLHQDSGKYATNIKPLLDDIFVTSMFFIKMSI